MYRHLLNKLRLFFTKLTKMLAKDEKLVEN